MNRNVNAISGRLSLRKPQRDSLELLHRLTEILSWEKGSSKKSPDLASALAAIRSEFPTVTDFEREFASLCFALATGVGKTRLMGAFIAYLHLEHGINNFFVMAPNLTIYNKLIDDFTKPTRPKYVFKGIGEFALTPPEVITGDTYENIRAVDQPMLTDFTKCFINIFNISKINSEVRGGKSPRIKRLSEYIGESYFDYLAGLPDLVLIMDESHRYRASAGVRAINELKPILGLELTATPFVEGTGGKSVPFKNVILDYPLGRAMADGFVKEPAVVTRKDFDPKGMSPEAIEQLKLEDGVRMHEQTKVLLETYAREASVDIVKPFVLVIARDTTHAKQLWEHIQSDEFFGGRYRNGVKDGKPFNKVIQVDSSKTGAEEEQMISDLLKVEQNDEPTEIVIHVNMLKEGWDVTNLYTIVPLRAANARILIEQSIGRGLRLPYGKRTGVAAVDRLSIIAHDKFQEIIDEASKPGSMIKMQQVILTSEAAGEKTSTVVSESNLKAKLGFQPENQTSSTENAGKDTQPAFDTPDKQRVAQLTYETIRNKLEVKPGLAPTLQALMKPEVQKFILQEVQAQYQPQQLEMEGIAPKIDVAAIVSETTSLVVKEMIPIPRILVVPKGEVKSWFEPFMLELGSMKFPVPSKDLWAHNLHTGKGEAVTVSNDGAREKRMEDYVVAGLVDFDDVSYDTNADLLYDLATQTVSHFRTYLPEEEIWQVLHFHQKDIAVFIHAQMHKHFREEVAGYDVVVSKGFTELKDSAYTAKHGEPPLDYRQSPTDKSNMAKYLFGGFQKCLYPVQKFDSDSERRLAGILERDAIKWFKPAKGQFQMFYRDGADHREYVPDFVAETETTIYMLEPKAKNEMQDATVLTKKEVAETWCQNASDYNAKHGGKPWKYALIPHDIIADNMSLERLGKR
jgi:type III restriction enzyme